MDSSDDLNEESLVPSGRASWFMLNGYVLMIALLEITAGVFWLLRPDCGGPCSRVPVVGLFIHIAYLVSGLGLVIALLTRLVDLEVAASLGLVVANVTASVRQVLIGEDQVPAFIVSAIIVFAVALRCVALWRGGKFTIPTWRLKR